MRSPDRPRRLGFVALLVAVFGGSLALAQAGDPRRSGYQDMGAALQRMQDDDTANPAMLFVQLGEQLWSKPAGAAGKPGGLTVAPSFVKTGARHDGKVAVLEGVAAGDRVVSAGQIKLHNGSAVVLSNDTALTRPAQTPLN